jgi:hypothetical protein
LKKFFAIACIAATLVACNGGGDATPAALQVGDSYQGGKIAYIYQVGDPGYVEGQTHGIIAAPSDQSKGITWWPPEFYDEVHPAVGVRDKALGTGNTNTNQIVTAYGIGKYAAKLCYDLVLNGYDDWYLPSMDELEKLHVNRAEVGGFEKSGQYWSSSEHYGNVAWGYYFDGGGAYSSLKYYALQVRAVRAF